MLPTKPSDIPTSSDVQIHPTGVQTWPPEEAVSMLFQWAVLKQMSVITQDFMKDKGISGKHLIDYILQVSISLLIRRWQAETGDS